MDDTPPDAETVRNRCMPPGTMIPELAYEDPRAAAAWLVRAFGFRERLRIANHRVQLIFGGGAMVAVDGGAAAGDGAPPRTHGILVHVADVDAHHARAVEAGARTAGPPRTHMYGERQYSAVDPGGHRWTFSQSVADVDPASFGGELVGGE